VKGAQQLSEVASIGAAGVGSGMGSLRMCHQEHKPMLNNLKTVKNTVSLKIMKKTTSKMQMADVSVFF